MNDPLSTSGSLIQFIVQAMEYSTQNQSLAHKMLSDLVDA